MNFLAVVLLRADLDRRGHSSPVCKTGLDGRAYLGQSFKVQHRTLKILIDLALDKVLDAIESEFLTCLFSISVMAIALMLC